MSVTPTFERLSSIACALQECGIDPGRLSSLAENPEDSVTTIQDIFVVGLECCNQLNGISAAEMYLKLAREAISSVVGSTGAQLEVLPDVEVDDFAVSQKVAADGTVKEQLRKVKGTMKDMVRHLEPPSL